MFCSRWPFVIEQRVGDNALHRCVSTHIGGAACPQDAGVGGTQCEAWPWPSMRRSFGEEEVALNHAVQQTADAVAAGFRLLDDPINRLAITEPDRRAGRVNGELAGEIAGELGFIFEQEAFEIADVVERPAV